MLISICGTPGVGKTSSASMLVDHGWDIVHEKELIRDLGLFTEIESKNGEMIVDPHVLRDGLGKWTMGLDRDTVLDGHLSYLAPSDLILLLRLDPIEVRDRLKERDYDQEKMMENVEAEAVGTLLFRCLEEEEKALQGMEWSEMGEGQSLVLERDVTGMSPEMISQWFLDMIWAFRDKKLKMISVYRPGKVDWLEAYSQWC